MPFIAENVCFGYRGRLPIVCDLSLQVEAGEWLAVVGANGSGRSTLAQVAAGLRKPSSGRLLLDGQDIWGENGRALRQRLGLVMQRAEDQFLGHTVYEDIAFGPRQRELDEEAVDEAVVKTLSLVGFDAREIGERSPLQFSGGQRRRLALAGILALGPRVLVLDEPFAGLDHEARNEVHELVKRLAIDLGVTLITLTSDIESVAAASRISLLYQGHIVLTGHMADFVANQATCREAGIGLPEPIQLALALRERGWHVPVLGPEGSLEASIASEWRQRKHA